MCGTVEASVSPPSLLTHTELITGSSQSRREVRHRQQSVITEEEGEGREQGGGMWGGNERKDEEKETQIRR